VWSATALLFPFINLKTLISIDLSTHHTPPRTSFSLSISHCDALHFQSESTHGSREKTQKNTLFTYVYLSFNYQQLPLFVTPPFVLFFAREERDTVANREAACLARVRVCANSRESPYVRSCVRACLRACVRMYVYAWACPGRTKKKSVYYNIRWSCRLYILLVLLSLTVSHRNDILLPGSLLLVLVMSLSLPLLPLSYCVRRGMNFIIGARATLRRHS